MDYDMDWITRVRAAKGNTTNTNTYDYHRTKPRVSAPATIPTTIADHLSPEMKARLDQARARIQTNIRYARPRNASQLRASGGVSRPMRRGEKEAYAEARGIRYTGTTALSTPSRVYDAMGIRARASSSGWDTVPIRTFDSNEIYRHPANNNLYILGPSGQVAQYQPHHRRLYDQVGSGRPQAEDYPNWFDDDTIEFVESMGGITAYPFHSETLL